MPNPAALTPDAVDVPDSQLYEAEVLDDAAEAGVEIRCVVPSFAEHLATDPLAWTPYVTASGVFYPKKDDRAIVALPAEGPPAIVAWWPSATKPDHPFS